MKFLADFFPVILFFIAYKMYGIYVATAAAIAASVTQVGVHWFRHHKLEKMHVITLVLLVVFGGLTIILQDRAFIMWKPSIVNWLFALVFLGSHLIGDKPLIQRMMDHAIEIPDRIWARLNRMWVLFFIASGAANLYVANRYFVVEDELRALSGTAELNIDDCPGNFTDQALSLCLEAVQREETWVNFKLFGMMGLTIAFVLLQAFYMARYVKDEEPQQEN